MKSFIKIFVPLAAAAIALIACQKEEKNDDIIIPSTLEINVTANAESLLGEASTRTYISGSSILWGTNEQMMIGVFDGTATKLAASTSTDAYNGEGVAEFHFSITPENATNDYTYYGLYPASAAVASTNTNPATYKVALPESQSASASSYDPKAYILVAKPDPGHTDATADWKASYRRATALNKITLTALSEDINRVEITAPAGCCLAGRRYIDLTTGDSGDFYSNDYKFNKIEVRFANPLAGGANMDVWFTSWEVEIAEGQDLTVVAYSNAHTFTRTITAREGGIKFMEGKLNTLQISMNGATQGDNTELAEDDYLILANNNGTYYALKAQAENTRMDYESYTGSTSSYNGDALLVWTVSKSGNHYTIENDGKFLGWTSGNTASLNAAGESWTTTNYLLDITWDTDHYKVSVASDSERILGKNTTSQYGFAFYGNTGYNELIFVPATVDNRSDVTLSFAETTVNLTTAAGSWDNFFGQSVVASPNDAAITSNITWSYEDNDGIIDDFDEGDLLLTGDPGTATITASFAGDSNFRPATASYTIIVANSSEPTWEETALSDISASDVFVIVGNGNYAINNTVNSSSSPTAVSVTVSGTQLSGTIPDTIKWNLATATGGYTFYPNGDSEHWLGSNTTASSSNNTSIRVATASRKVWELDASNHLLTNDSYSDRYLAVYNGTDWRGYLNTNSSPTTFKFYKYTINDGKTDAGVSLSYSGSAVTYGDADVQLALTNPNGVTVTCTSSETGVATVTNAALATIVGAGTTTITAAWDEQTISGTTYRAGSVTYELTVAKATPTIAAFSNPVTSVAVGSTVTNTTTISPSGLAITYTSSDTGVATVTSAGVVTGVADGTATISAIFAGNDNFNAATSQSYTITVGTGGGNSGTDWSTTYTSNVNVGSDKISVDGTQYDCAKVGTSKAGGSTSVTVPAGTTTLHVHMAAYGTGTPTISISGGSASPASIQISGGGISGNSPYTLSTGAGSDHYYEITLSGVTSNTSITFTTSDGGTSRFVLWGVNAE